MTITAVIPILFLISGYGFLANWKLAQWYTARQAGHRLYLRIALYGMFMFIISCLIYAAIWPKEIYQFYLDYHSHQQSGSTTPFEFSQYTFLLIKIQLISVLCGVLGGHLLTALFTYFFKTLNLKLLEDALKDNDFELLLMRSMKKITPVLFTAKSGKVYAGLVNRSEEPQNARTHIRILPLLSGYRDINTLRVEFTTNYHDIYMQLGIGLENGVQVNPGVGPHPYLVLEDFELILPFKDIQSANLFDIDTFLAFESQAQASDDE